MNKEESKSGFVNGIVKAFDKFVATFKKHGLLYVTFILVLFMILYSFIIYPINLNDIVQKTITDNKKAEQELAQKSMQQRLQADKIMLSVMNELCANYGVDHAMLFELHNSVVNASGVDLLYLSASYETINPNDYDEEYIADNFQRQFLTQTIGQESFAQLKHAEYLYFNNLDNYHRTNYRLIAKLKHFGAKSVMLIPFTNADKVPLLILVLTSKNNEMDAQKIYNYVKNFRSSIENCLMNL